MVKVIIAIFLMLKTTASLAQHPNERCIFRNIPVLQGACAPVSDDDSGDQSLLTPDPPPNVQPRERIRCEIELTSTPPFVVAEIRDEELINDNNQTRRREWNNSRAGIRLANSRSNRQAMANDADRIRAIGSRSNYRRLSNGSIIVPVNPEDYDRLLYPTRRDEVVAIRVLSTPENQREEYLRRLSLQTDSARSVPERIQDSDFAENGEEGYVLVNSCIRTGSTVETFCSAMEAVSPRTMSSSERARAQRVLQNDGNRTRSQVNDRMEDEFSGQALITRSDTVIYTNQGLRELTGGQALRVGTQGDQYEKNVCRNLTTGTTTEYYVLEVIDPRTSEVQSVLSYLPQCLGLTDITPMNLSQVDELQGLLDILSDDRRAPSSLNELYTLNDLGLVQMNCDPVIRPTSTAPQGSVGQLFCRGAYGSYHYVSSEANLRNSDVRGLGSANSNGDIERFNLNTNGSANAYNLNSELERDRFLEPRAACAFTNFLSVYSDYRENCGNCVPPVQWGDMFDPVGEHRTHDRKTCVDLRPVRTDGQMLGLMQRGGALEVEQTMNIISMLVENGATEVRFDGSPSSVRRRVQRRLINSYGRSNDNVDYHTGGHADHIHVCFEAELPNGRENSTVTGSCR